jgi:hypothetical protein
VFPNVVLFVLRKAMDEERPCARLEYNQRPKPARLSPARTRDPLLDNPASKIGGNQTSFGFPKCFAQHDIIDAGLTCKARERFVLEYSHLPLPELPWGTLNPSITPSAIDRELALSPTPLPPQVIDGTA